MRFHPSISRVERRFPRLERSTSHHSVSKTPSGDAMATNVHPPASSIACPHVSSGPPRARSRIAAVATCNRTSSPQYSLAASSIPLLCPTTMIVRASATYSHAKPSSPPHRLPSRPRVLVPRRRSFQHALVQVMSQLSVERREVIQRPEIRRSLRSTEPLIRRSHHLHRLPRSSTVRTQREIRHPPSTRDVPRRRRRRRASRLGERSIRVLHLRLRPRRRRVTKHDETERPLLLLVVVVRGARAATARRRARLTVSRK